MASFASWCKKTPPTIHEVVFLQKQTRINQASKFNAENTETGKPVKQHKGDALSKIQAVQNSTRRTAHFLQQINYKEKKKELNKETTDYEN